MNKRMDQIRFMVDLNWKIWIKGFDRTFADHNYFEQFMQFLRTDVGQDWLTKENGIAFKEWQEV